MKTTAAIKRINFLIIPVLSFTSQDVFKTKLFCASPRHHPHTIIGGRSVYSDANRMNQKKNPTFITAKTKEQSTMREEEDTKSVVDDDSTNNISQREQTKAALSKLIERQKRELEDIENLYHKLEMEESIIDPSNDTQFWITQMITNSTKSTMNISSVAASVSAAADYGFFSRSEGCPFDDIDTIVDPLFDGYGPPANIISLATQQFKRNLDAIQGQYKDEKSIGLTSNQKILQAKLKQLTLNSTAIWERERSRGPINAPLIVKIPYLVLCYSLDVLFEGRYVPSRFFLLETVARMPYFSYIAMLHLYETLGWWRRSSDVKRVHFAEEWNEFHHLLMMESLGGDQAWWVRFLAQHSAIVYFWGLTVLFASSPSLAYKFSELLETHAVDTYGQFLDENEELLTELPPCIPAVDYYSVGISDPMFGEYQTSASTSGEGIRRPGFNMKSLYDVFDAIQSDEGDHVKTMKACLDDKTVVLSPSLENRVLIGISLTALTGYVATTGEFYDGAGDIVSDLFSDAEVLSRFIR